MKRPGQWNRWPNCLRLAAKLARTGLTPHKSPDDAGALRRAMFQVREQAGGYGHAAGENDLCQASTGQGQGAK
jgi:hypothetical protein